ncbi:ATP-dependent DNA helicase PIF1-like [Aphis craccivora]|uniref:ATP-dependent DNA helicase PIF1-like n=1 Tax=Aphis craccivora TaxID=307492 RepID=A0A6G0ZKQ1_APHCR|nr:ATP-dependent DNA helicase PIF1-like [Aphis craccivora]
MASSEFPIRLAFATTINKSHGQKMSVCNLNLYTPCFSHGQLYVACSRVGKPSSLFVLVKDELTRLIMFVSVTVKFPRNNLEPQTPHFNRISIVLIYSLKCFACARVLQVSNIKHYKIRLALITIRSKISKTLFDLSNTKLKILNLTYNSKVCSVFFSSRTLPCGSPIKHSSVMSMNNPVSTTPKNK